MAKNRIFVDVILPLALPGAFTYHVNAEDASHVTPGMRVIVQFGKRKYYSAIVFRIHDNEPQGYTTKPVQYILDDHPVINGFQLKLWDWIARYYMCTPGEVYKASLPSGLKLESETKVIFKPSFDEQNTPLSDHESLVVDLLKSEHVLGMKELAEKTGRKNVLPVINALMKKSAISVEEKLKDT